MKIYINLIVIFIFLVEILLVEGDFTCFRKHKRGRRREFCKGPMKNKRRYSTPEKCCKKGKGFAQAISKFGKNKYRCAPCSVLITTERPTTTPLPEWGDWNPCSATCGSGWRNRYRLCDNCDKDHFNNVMSQPCMINFYCPIDGNWGPWFAWTSCSASCGGGVRTRDRSCNYPPPTHGGRDCPGDTTVEEPCNEDPCPVDGNWSDWSRYSECSTTCGPGTMFKTRACDNPAPAHGGRDCRGRSRESRRCTIRNCPQNGGWSLWGGWTPCRVTCGTGQRERRRLCNSPRPLYGGRECEGEGRETKSCDAGRPCPQDGGWTSWTNYGRCRASRCETGYKVRSRSCVNPRPKHGGRPCVGRHYERLECVNTDNCPSEGQWCEWNNWSSCTATCTGLNSMQVRQRSCRCPEPNVGGQHCEGESFNVRECVDMPSCNVFSRNGNTGGSSVEESSGDGSVPTEDQEVDRETTTDEARVDVAAPL